jgi:hypothetical protein
MANYISAKDRGTREKDYDHNLKAIQNSFYLLINNMTKRNP